MKRLILFAALAVSSLAAHAQIGVYAGYTGSRLDVPNTDWVFGPTFGAYYNFTHLPVLNFGADARVSFITSSSTTKVTSGLIGPRVVVHVPAIPIRPYAEVLGGIAQSQYGEGDAYTNNKDFSYAFAGGVDIQIIPHLDWRIVDYTYTRIFNLDSGSTGEKSLTTGLVFRIPLS